ncbi:DUF2911 domain-containing protein [Psychroserpens luteolus]|uniref:DUF2911 domain-containing protein n=1 Tax=Psychroserpens luteolus TaxID=2855840 RepID=UPI001E514B1B|nr:DUF2911 domain-containing protein [Psychroserpens luteolus]MCD2259761.1 DUF2911 domain-containing protein [Psychroserpens luteolus]
MNTFLKRLLVTLSIVAVGLFLYSYFVEDIFSNRLSPKDTVEFKLNNDLKLEVFYNRPSKKGREIFGALVPYNKVWRTGANEATTFETNKDLMIQGIYLPKGKYTLWTVPKDSVWNVIFNKKQYPWGVDEEMQVMWDPNYDILEIDVPVEKLDTTVEQFTIAFDNSTDNLKLTMAWDNTKIAVPLSVLKDKK